MAPITAGLTDQIAVESPTRRIALIASCADVPSVSSAQEFLEVTSGAIVTHLRGTVETKTPMDFDGRPGLHLRMTIAADAKPPGILWPGALVYELRLFVAGTRQYQLTALHAADADVDDLRDPFFASFRLLQGAPKPQPAPAWTKHEVAGVEFEAPGRPMPLEANGEGFVDGVTFTDTSGYAASVWAAPPGASAVEKLRAHFLLRTATAEAEILSETETEAAGRPALDVTYRPNIPLPEHLAPTDPATREAVASVIASRPTTFRVRLVLAGTRVVQLLVRESFDEGDAPEVGRFLGSLRLP
jgi:hypothetical protein